MEEMNYEKCLDLILGKIEENPQLDIETLIDQQKETLGIDEKVVEKIKAVFHCIDKFDEKQKDLEKAKEEGCSRTEWLLNDVAEMSKANGLSEDETKQLLEGLQTEISNKDNK